jgi:methyltransferase (TIGR00027 family)
MLTNQPSITAEAMAAARAFGSHIYRERKILDDPFAVHFLSPDIARQFDISKRWFVGPLKYWVGAYYNWRFPGALGWVMVRHRYIDDTIRDAVRAGIKQLVVVGAGYDTRVFRLPELKGVRILEIDHPATQHAKLSVVRQVFHEPPGNITYVPVDVTTADFGSILKSNAAADVKTLVILEGFLWYLEANFAERLLRSIAKTLAEGSLVVFDYTFPSQVDGTCELKGAQEHHRTVAKLGEPIRFGVDPSRIGDLLKRCGLTLLVDASPDELSHRYGRVPMHEFFHIARAKVARDKS